MLFFVFSILIQYSSFFFLVCELMTDELMSQQQVISR